MSASKNPSETKKRHFASVAPGASDFKLAIALFSHKDSAHVRTSISANKPPQSCSLF